MTSWKNKLRSKRICCHYQCHHLLKANCSTKVFASMVSLWELHEACFWQGWDWEGSLALALAARWLTCLVQHPLFLKNSSSEFPLFLKWVTMGSNPTPSTPWCCVLPYDHIRFAPWRLWTLMFYFVSVNSGRNPHWEDPQPAIFSTVFKFLGLWTVQLFL